MKKLLYCFLLLFFVYIVTSCADVFPKVSDEALKLSCEPGVYKENFILGVSRQNKNNEIYFTTDGTPATTASEKYNSKKGIGIYVSDAKSEFKLTQNVKNYDNAVYNYSFTNKAIMLNLLETDKNGKEIARKSGTYIVSKNGTNDFKIPVVSLSAPPAQMLEMYNNVEIDGNGVEEKKYRANLEYMDYSRNEFFTLNTQMKIGGNWTKRLPLRTINLNFNKDANDKKYPSAPQADIFGGRKLRNGSDETTAGKVRRFRLHSGGNDMFAAFITDAFVQAVAAGSPYISTAAFRPCILYLNGEYWGLYSMREHYNALYFEYNYGVNKDNVIYVDKAPQNSEWLYGFEIEEGDESETEDCLVELFEYLEYDRSTKQLNVTKDWSTDEVYDGFCSMVDVDSLIDLILIQGYAGNWDFMNNNFRMWRTLTVENGNPFADTKWRFILHDVDFGFEDATADNGLATGDGTWNRDKKSYFDFYLGKTGCVYGASPVGVLSPRDHAILSLPSQNARFKTRVLERAQAIEALFAPDKALAVFNRMVSDVTPYYAARVTRWGAPGYSYQVWQNYLSVRRQKIQERPSYFMQQVKTAFGIN
jgi:hypothetical protein